MLRLNALKGIVQSNFVILSSFTHLPKCLHSVEHKRRCFEEYG